MKKETQKKMIRIGLVTKGLIYSLIAILALMSVFGQGGQLSGKRGIIKWLMEQPYGPYLVALVAVGLLFYAAWRFIRAFTDESSDDKHKLKNVAYAASGLMYLVFAVYAVNLVLSEFGVTGGGDGGGGSSAALEALLSSTAGRIVVLIFAGALVGTAVYHAYKAFSGSYREKVDSYNIDSAYKSYLLKAGYFGYLGRGLTFLILAYLFVRAVIEHDASKAGGTGSVFDFVQGAGGSVAVVAIAFGLLCYGVFVFIQARYKDIDAVL